MRISTVALILNSYTVAVPSLCQRVSVNLFSFTAFKNLSDSRESGRIWSVRVKACRKSLEFEIACQTPFFLFFFYFRLSFSSNLIPSASPYVSFYFILSILQANINSVKKKKKKRKNTRFGKHGEQAVIVGVRSVNLHSHCPLISWIIGINYRSLPGNTLLAFTYSDP